MKKTILTAIVLMSVFAFTSCKKDYNCTCTTTESGQGADPAITATAVIHDTESKAKASCEAGNSTVTDGTTTITTKCEIK